jgi:hypothetical protein
VWAKTLDLPEEGTTALALGAHPITFGNGNDLSEVLPSGVVPMGLGRFDPATGALASAVICGINQGRGTAITTSGTSVYMAGSGTMPGVFGRLSTTNAGVFVAKLK